MKRLVAFDLDGTLALSKQAIDDEMARILADLSKVAAVCVISGGDWPQFEKQVIGRLPADAVLEEFFIMPTTGAKLYRFQHGAWQQIYAETFTEDERSRIFAALDKAGKAVGLDKEKQWGERIEDRGAQITLSALGQQAPLDAKEAWDPDRSKREVMQKMIIADLPDLSVKLGGTTSVDITHQGVDKARGMEKLAEASGIPKTDMIFLGDAVFPGGNDFPVPDKARVDTIAVAGVGETKRAVQAIVLCLKG